MQAVNRFNVENGSFFIDCSQADSQGITLVYDLAVESPCDF